MKLLHAPIAFLLALVLQLGAAAAPGDDSDALLGAWLAADGQAAPLVFFGDGRARRGEEVLTWKRFGKRKLRFAGDSGRVLPAYTLEGDTLAIEWKEGAVEYSRAPASYPVTPLPLAGAAAMAKGTPWRHPKDDFHCMLPKGWTVAEVHADTLLINPGLQQGDVLHAIPFVGWGRLEGEDLRRSPTELLRANEKEWLEMLAAEGARFKRAKKRPTRVLVGKVPGAQQEWEGRIQGTRVRMWVGALKKGESFLSVAIITTDEGAPKYLPLAKQLFLSMVPTPPERNRALEKALAGRKMTSSSFVGRTAGYTDSTGWSYTFHQDGSLESFWTMSGGTGGGLVGGSTTEWGRYEVHGTELFVFLESGQEVGTVILERGVPVAIEMNGKRYRI